MDWLLDRSSLIEGLDEIAIATSNRPADDPLEQYCLRYGLACFRGEIDDVAGRVLACAKRRGYDAVARINGDSPLLDFDVFTLAVAKFRSGAYDVVTNVFPRSFPIGNSVEVFSTGALQDARTRMTTRAHQEHVTLYFYEDAVRYRIFNLTREGANVAGLSLALDTPTDLRRLEWMLEQVAGDGGKLVGDVAVKLALEYARDHES